LLLKIAFAPGSVIASFDVAAAETDGNATNNAAVVEVSLLDTIFANGFESGAP